MNGHRASRGHHVVAVVLGLVVIVAGAVYARQVDWRTVLTVMRRAAPTGLALAFIFHVLSIVAKAGVWWVCLRALGAPAFRTVTRITFVGAALNSLTIANSGEAGRVVLITRASHIRTPGALATVVLDHVIRTGGLVVLLAAAVLFTAFPLPHSRVMIAVLVALAATPALLVRRGHRGAGARVRRARTMPSIVRAARVFAWRTLASGRRVMTPKRLALAAPFTLVTWACELGSFHAVALAAHLPIPLTGSLLALLTVNLGFVVRATPANVGVFELSYAAAAVTQGASPDAALAAGMLLHLVQDVPTIVLGILLGHGMVRPTRATRSGRRAPTLASTIAPADPPALPLHGETPS